MSKFDKKDTNKIEIDLKHIWHPCSQMMEYESFPPIHIKRGEGVWLYKDDGSKILDAISSWWVNLFGHSNPYIAQKISEQAHKLEHVIFANYTHTPALRLGERLSKLLNDRLPKVFFADNGSSAIEVALKMSYHYWYNQGQKDKNRFMYVSGAYHGETLGALSVGSIDLFKKIYEPLLLNTTEIGGPDCYRCKYGLDRNSCDAQCFAQTEKDIKKEYKNISAIIIEPILQCAAGMHIYSPKYLTKLRELTKELNIHLICDEIATGFGRTGKMFAHFWADIVPDFVCLSKGLTGGFLPLSIVMTSDTIYDAFYGPYLENRAFLHSHSYTGNPIACEAANATLDLFDETNILDKNIETGKYIYDRIASITNHKNIGEVRSLGMVTAIEIVESKESKKSFDPQKRVGHQIYRLAESKGVLLRNLGDIIYFMPPYIINKEEIDFMTEVAKESILEIVNKVRF